MQYRTTVKGVLKPVAYLGGGHAAMKTFFDEIHC